LEMATGRNANYLLVAGTCQQCKVDGCALCPGNVWACKRCMSGHALSGSRCVQVRGEGTTSAGWRNVDIVTSPGSALQG